MTILERLKRALEAILANIRRREPATLEEAKAQLILLAAVAEEALAE